MGELFHIHQQHNRAALLRNLRQCRIDLFVGEVIREGRIRCEVVVQNFVR